MSRHGHDPAAATALSIRLFRLSVLIIFSEHLRAIYIHTHPSKGDDRAIRVAKLSGFRALPSSCRRRRRRRRCRRLESVSQIYLAFLAIQDLSSAWPGAKDAQQQNTDIELT